MIPNCKPSPANIRLCSALRFLEFDIRPTLKIFVKVRLYLNQIESLVNKRFYLQALEYL